jgi:Hypothetical protein (DUF2513)
MEVARDILRQVADYPKPNGWADIAVDGHTAEEIAYHVKLLTQAGFIEATDVSTLASFDWRAESLTWDGHEFLDAISNDTVWSKVKKVVSDKGGSIAFEVLKELAIQTGKAHFLNP